MIEEPNQYNEEAYIASIPKKSKLTIGDQLKAARVELGLTQVELWEKSRVSVFTISQLEMNKAYNSSTHTIRALQFALGITFEI